MRRKKSTYAFLLTLTTLLSSCKTSEDYIYPGANWKDNVVVLVDGKEYKYKDIYNLFNGKKESASAYYSIAKNVLTQLVTERNASMQDIVEGKMEDYREQWTTNAKNNNTSYDEEKQKTLDSEGVLDEDALESKLYLAEQVTSNENAYLKENPGANDYQYYINEETTKSYVKDNAPYHVSHILIKVDASSDGVGRYDGKISADDANQIGNVVKNLISNDSFGSVAQQLSDDTGSAAKQGELADSSNGVAMKKSTSYINEFKLGIYAYDAFINKSTSTGDLATTVKKSLRVPGQALDDNSQDDSVSNIIGDTNIGKKEVFGIPLSIALTMNVVSSKEKSDFGSKPTNATESQYPRNIYFNNYFNQHSVSFIYNDAKEYKERFLNEIKEAYKNQDNYKDIAYVSKADAKAAGADESNSIEAKLPTRYDEYVTVSTLLDTYTSNTDEGSIYRKKFKSFKSVANSESKLVTYTGTIKQNSSNNKYYASTTVEEISGDKDILTDERGNPIIVVRGGSDSYQGIHFITVNNDPFVDADNSYKYWTTTIPDSAKALTSAAYSSNYSTNPTFINFVTDSTSAKTTYKDRASWIKNDIKASYSSVQEYNLWNYNLTKFKEKYNTDFLDLLGDNKAVVVDYIDSQIKGTNKTANDTLDTSWSSYINLLDVSSTIQRRGLIPTVCVSYFNRGSYSVKETADGTETNKGEGCHVTI